MEDHSEMLLDDRVEHVTELTVSQEEKECNPQELMTQQNDEVAQEENGCNPEELSQQSDEGKIQ